jgi:hypothetical protein
MLRLFVRVALSASIGLSFAGVTPGAEQGTAARPLPSAGQARILAAFDEPTEFDFRERPLGEVIDYFKQKHEIEIVLDGKALSDAGVGTDTPVTLTLKKTTLHSALRLLLRPLDLTCILGDGYLMITSKTEAESKLSFKVYPVEDLVTLESDFRPALAAAGSFPGLVVSGPTGTLDRNDEAYDFTGLIEMITCTVAPTTWDEVGGPGSITPNRNTQAIGVSQTDDVHEEIVALLAALRRARDEQIAAAKPVAGVPLPEATEKKKPLEVHGYRLMRGPKNPGKSGWRPPQGVVGDSTPPGDAKAAVKKPEAPSSDQGGTEKEAPAREAASDEGARAEKRVPTKPADDKLEAWVERITKVVPEMIEPESWEPSGEGMIRAVGEGIVVRHTEEVHHRVARLMAELLPDYVPVVDFVGPWGPWRAVLLRDHAAVRLRPVTTANWPHQAEPRPSGEEACIHEALLEKCDLEFDQLPLIDALSRLADLHQVQLYVDGRALSDAGVGTDTPVTLFVKGLSCRTALRLLLDELDLAYLIRDQVLLITSKTEAENMLTTKVYPVFDLVVRPPDLPASRPGLDFTSLIENIGTNIAPTTWDEVGGPGAIQPFTNSAALVISQTTEVHEEIAEYLRAMREAGAAQKHQPTDANR